MHRNTKGESPRVANEKKLCQKDFRMYAVHRIVTEICIFGNSVPDAEVETTINNWLQQQAVDFFDTGIQKLVMRYNKCLDSAGD
jgi:hypothetical protein